MPDAAQRKVTENAVHCYEMAGRATACQKELILAILA
jgi:hypothetical protein